MRPRGLRNRLTAALGVGAFLALATLTAGFNLLLRSNLDSDADRVLRSSAESALETVRIDGHGRLRLLEAPGSQDPGSRIWIYARGRALERPPEPPPLQRLSDSLAGSDDAFAEAPETETRLYGLGIPGVRGEQVGTVVAALSVEPYERTADKALYASLLFAGLTLMGIVITGRFLVGRALRPVSRMTAAATEWSEHDLDHRFGVGQPYDELTRLAGAFDSMLERLASSLRHEQRLSAEISHELRTPLSAILAEAELALAGERGTSELRLALSRVEKRARQLSRILEALLAAARAEIGSGRSTAIVEDALARCIGDLSATAQARGIELRADEERAHHVDVEEELLERMLAPLLENACRYARSSVEVVVRREADRVVIRIRDDGPGLADDEVERIFEAGYRGAAAEPAGERDGAGLGLALGRRLARAAGGEVRALPSGPGGAAFELSLPATGGP